MRIRDCYICQVLRLVLFEHAAENLLHISFNFLRDRQWQLRLPGRILRRNEHAFRLLLLRFNIEYLAKDFSFNGAISRVLVLDLDIGCISHRVVEATVLYQDLLDCFQSLLLAE